MSPTAERLLRRMEIRQALCKRPMASTAPAAATAPTAEGGLMSPEELDALFAKSRQRRVERQKLSARKGWPHMDNNFSRARHCAVRKAAAGAFFSGASGSLVTFISRRVSA